MSYISLNMNLSFSMVPTFNLSWRNKYLKYVLCFSLTSIWINHLFAKMNSYMENLSVESCTRSLAHANMKCSIGKKLSIYITPPCAIVFKTMPLSWHIVSHITLKVDLVWSNCSRFIYHKEMNTTSMTFAAPSLQLRSNTFFHSYEFEYRKLVLNRRSRSFFQTGTFSKKKRYPFILCYNGRHYSNIEDAKTEVWTTVLMYLPFFTQIVRRNAAWQYYNYFQRAYFALKTALCLKWGFHFNFHFS